MLFISNHFREDIRLDEIAAQTGLSKYHFHRLFVKETHSTPQSYLEKIRMEHASHYMILYPDTSMTDVAFESGYSSPACFSRAFRNYYGVAPTQYRTQHKLQKAQTGNNQPTIAVKYLPTTLLEVQKVPLNHEYLNKAYKEIMQRGIPTKEVFGVYLDVPIHVPAEECRHYIGIAGNHLGKSKLTISMPAGFYTSMVVTGDLNDFKDHLFSLHHAIEQAGFRIDSLLGYEKLILFQTPEPFDYLSIPREVLVKIKRA